MRISELTCVPFHSQLLTLKVVVKTFRNGIHTSQLSPSFLCKNGTFRTWKICFWVLSEEYGCGRLWVIWGGPTGFFLSSFQSSKSERKVSINCCCWEKWKFVGGRGRERDAEEGSGERREKMVQEGRKIQLICFNYSPPQLKWSVCHV